MLLSALVNRPSEWLNGLASGCDRLINPSVTDGERRTTQGRLLGVLLAGPLILAIAAIQVLVPVIGVVTTLGFVCALFILAWLCVLCVAATGREGFAGGVMLAGFALFIGLIVAGAGGMASPLALMVVSLVVETWWVGGSARAVWAGMGAGAVALAIQAGVSNWIFAAQPLLSGWQWLVPLVYLASGALRLQWFLGPGIRHGQGSGKASLEQAVDAVVLRMTIDSDVVDVSQKAWDLLRLQPELLLAGGFVERIHVADRVAYLSAIADLREGARQRACEVRLRLPSGADQQQGDNYHAFLIELTRPYGAGEIIGLLRCNGEMAQLRTALAEATEIAENGDAVRARFLATVSHELRTPLNAIVGFSDMLLHGICGPLGSQRQEEYLRLIGLSGQHLLGVVNSILDVSKIESGAYAIHPEMFRFDEVVETCRAMVALQAENKNISLTVRLAAGVSEIVGDRCSVRQILINLLANAIKFTPEGGHVLLKATRIGSLLHFAVTDTGIGMEAADLARIAEPFTQIRNDYTRQHEGSGLGLSIVKGLVGLHGGTMTIESAPGEGTTVAISLPVEGPDCKAAFLPESNVLSIKSVMNEEKNDGTLRKVA